MSTPPPAAIRRQVSIPLRFADGYTTAARVYTFSGLVDRREHLAFGLGPGPPQSPGAPARCRWSGCTANA